MKNYLFLFLAVGLFTFSSCGDDDSDTHTASTTDYKITFINPAPDNSTIAIAGETLNLEIEFEDQKGGTVHHVNVRIFQKDDDSVVMYDGPGEAHVHEMSGKYVFTHDLFLDPAMIPTHTDWVVVAKVWEEEAGVGEVEEIKQFHTHPL